ncbi:MAG: hypothetical protein DI498_02715 [Paracoccus denitrificans]|nr:MAG: hypothetical protein DI498_02715 [Paracoccus denitrificans]PZO85454.1 MAG: hypothetical protein DI633_02715 [Paracoccus denitrificans]
MIGAIQIQKTDDAAAILTAALGVLSGAGLRVGGAIQTSRPPTVDAFDCDMHLSIIGEDAAPVRISQSLGPGSTACRLDTGALAACCARVMRQLHDGCDALILNKFGKVEAAGGGLRDAFALGASLGVPVLTTVAPDQRAVFLAFAGDLATLLKPSEVPAWCHAACFGRVA